MGLCGGISDFIFNNWTSKGYTSNIWGKIVRSNSHFRMIFKILSDVDEMYGVEFKIFCPIIHDLWILYRNLHLLCVIYTRMFLFFCACFLRNKTMLFVEIKKKKTDRYLNVEMTITRFPSYNQITVGFNEDVFVSCSRPTVRDDINKLHMSRIN